MSAPDLPKRIAITMVAAILCFLLALAGSVHSIRLGMDDRAEVDSVRLVGSRIKALQVGLAATTKDYAIWTAAFDHIIALDLDWVHENFSVSAIDGDLFNGLVLSGGPLPAPVAWVQDGPVAGGPSFLTKQLAMEVAARVSLHDPAGRQTENFVVLLQGRATLVSASQVKPDDAGPDVVPATLPQAVVTRSLTDADLAQIAAELALTDLRFTAAPAPGQPSFALDGVTGTAVVHLTWQPPRPGTQLVRTMLPVLLLVASAFAALAGGGAMLMRKYARQLVVSEQAATRLARQDSMTGLPNRLGFIEHLHQVENAGIGKIAVLFMDINGFKRINDTMGHDCGDSVVRSFAERMRGLASREVYFARVGGDEFVFVVQDGDDVTARLAALTQGFADRMVAPFQIGGAEINLRVSQGYAVKDEPDQTTGELLRRADLAMYHAKRSGLGAVVEYDAAMDHASRRHLRLARALQQSLDRPEQFELLYQPIADARTSVVARAEVIVRWRSPDLGPVDADDLVAVAEAAGLVGPLGWLLLDLIAVDLAQSPALQVCINFSPQHLALPQFAAQVQNRLARHHVDPGRITVELPEPGLTGMADTAAHQLDLLHQAGFSSVLDHLGRGMSSIRCLRQMPFKALKIDESLSGPAVLTVPGAHLIRAVVHLGQALGQRVICDGISTAEQARVVADLGCDQIQGLHTGAALPLAELLHRYPELDRCNPQAA